MVWTIATSGGVTTITPDGTSNADLSTLLDTAISGGQSGISKPAPFTYQISNTLVVAADPGNTHFLFCSGISLISTGRFIRNGGSRVKFTEVDSAGRTVGRFKLLINRSIIGYQYLEGLFTISNTGTAYQETNAIDLIFKATDNSEGAVLLGYDAGGRSTGIIQNSTFIGVNLSSRSVGQICYLDNSIYSNCTFSGWNFVELTSDALSTGLKFVDITTLQNNDNDSYLELTQASNFRVQNTRNLYATDCDISSFSVANNGASAYQRNSFTLLGATNEANGLFVLRLPSNAIVYKRTLNGSGQIAGGNLIGTTNSSSSSSDRLIVELTRINPPSTYIYDRRGTWEGIFVKYGRLPVVFSYDLQGTLATRQSVPFGSLSDLFITQSNSATVAGYTQYTINHVTSTVTISGANTRQQFHDFSALEKASFADSGVTTGGNPVPKCCLPALATRIYERGTGVCLYNLSIANPSSTPTGIDSITMASGTSVTLQATGNYSAAIIEARNVTVAGGGTTNLQGWTFASGSTINRTSGSATVIVDQSQIANVTAGTGVTLSSRNAITATWTGPSQAYVSIQVGGSEVVNSGLVTSPYTYNYEYTGTPTVTVKILRQGWSRFTTTFAANSSNATTVSAALLANQTAYTGSTNAALTITVDAADSAHKIRIGNAQIPVQTIYDVVEDAAINNPLRNNLQVFPTLTINGAYLTLNTSTQLIRNTAGDVNAAVLGAVFRTDGSGPIDGTNGSIALLGPQGLTQQNVRDAMALALTVGTTVNAGSVDSVLLSTQSASLAVADGRQRIDYSGSSFTLYNSDGTVRKVFALKDASGNPATTSATAVERA